MVVLLWWLLASVMISIVVDEGTSESTEETDDVECVLSDRPRRRGAFREDGTLDTVEAKKVATARMLSVVQLLSIMAFKASIK